MEQNVSQINPGITLNVDVSVKNNIYEKKHYVQNPATFYCKNGKYLANITDESVIICDEVIKSYGEEIKTIPTNFNEKNITYKTQNFCILPAFLFITTT